MSKRALVAMAVVLLSSTARAEGDPAAAPPPAPAAPAVVAPAAAPPEALPPAAPALAPTRLPPAFMDKFLSYDAEQGEIYLGKKRKLMSRDEVYTMTNRPDLLEKSHAASRRRLILGISAVGVLATGLGAMAIARAGLPNLNSDFCVFNEHNYNEICVPDFKRREAISAAGLVGGIALGSVLGALAYWSSPSSIMTKDETAGLVSRHNAALLKRLQNEKSGLHLSPYASLQGGGATVSFRF